MNHKFTFKVFNKQETDFDWVRFGQVKNALPDGDYELILREKPTWDTDQMRKYFHGPVLKFIQEQFKKCGYMFGKNDIKENLKSDFGPHVKMKADDHAKYFRNSGGMVKSTSEYDFKTYTQFLNDINAWCIECFECGLPIAEEVD